MFIVDDATEGVHPLSPILLLYLFFARTTISVLITFSFNKIYICLQRMSS